MLRTRSCHRSSTGRNALFQKYIRSSTLTRSIILSAIMISSENSQLMLFLGSTMTDTKKSWPLKLVKVPSTGFLSWMVWRTAKWKISWSSAQMGWLHQRSHSGCIPQNRISALYSPSGKKYHGVCGRQRPQAFLRWLENYLLGTYRGESTGCLGTSHKKRSEKYPNSMKSWKQNWDAISPIFKFSAVVRKVIYTTNTI